MDLAKSQVQMRKGILEYCILLILSKQDAYASEIIKILKNSELIVVEGTLYPLLTRLKNAELLIYRWEESKQGPPRKYYVISEGGKIFLNKIDYSWNELVNTINTLKSL